MAPRNLLFVTVLKIDGKKLDLNNIDSNIITEDGKNYAKKGDIIYTHLTVGAIGCAQSHRAIYQKIVDENINSCLILEDDITLDDKFNEKIKYIENQIKVNNKINSKQDFLTSAWLKTACSAAL